MTVPLPSLNFDEDGDRVANPRRYGTFLKVRSFAGPRHFIQWSQADMPEHMLRGLLLQLDQARAHVVSALGLTT
jgi:hypothetical protein